MAEQEYDELLRQEAERLRIQGYQPQVCIITVFISRLYVVIYMQ